MILAMITHNDEQIQVEVIDTDLSKNTADVRALRGEPFIEATHGGWAYSSYGIARIDQLKEIGVTCPLCGELVLPTTITDHGGFGEPPAPPEDVFRCECGWNGEYVGECEPIPEDEQIPF